ncbi:unnamed protein product [Prorocentrum cordatum]|uniref:Subtilisin n=1 Tax=Prorocentrum cordatum TaxID=2364126 RepID=A0ABN9XEC9_9DINO|nr:unnamed protein product [Polarella glacialis]
MRSMLQELGLDNVRVVVSSAFGGSRGPPAPRSCTVASGPGGSTAARSRGGGPAGIVTQLGSGRCPLPTAYLQANPEFAAVSSTLLRGRVERRQDISHLVPPGCANAVTAAYSRR